MCQGNDAVCGLSPTEQNNLPLFRVESERDMHGETVNQVCYCDTPLSNIASSPNSPSFYCQNLDSDIGLAIDTSLGSFLEHCPRLEALRLSGSLCSAETMKQLIQGMRPVLGNPISLPVLGLGPVGAGVLWSDVSHVLNFVALDAGLQRVVIADDVLKPIPADDRSLTLEKFTELRNKGVDVLFAKHRRVEDLF